jgi:hypothetical protein
MRGGKTIDEELKVKKLAFEDGLDVAAKQKEVIDITYPKMEFKAKEYCQLSKSEVLEMHAKKADGVIPYYAQKLHVSLALQDGDHEKVWDQVLLELFKNPCVFAVKILSPYATFFGREAQPGKEVTIYFLRPEDMNPQVSLPSVKIEHLKVMKQLDNLLLPLGIKPSVAPTNMGEPEYNAAQVCNNDENPKKGLDLKSSSIYISPPDQNERGDYVHSNKREHKIHTYTKYILDHYRRCDAGIAKLDFLISIMPILIDISAQRPNIEFQNLLDTILATIHKENTGACLDSIKVFADYCSQSRQEPEEKTVFFSKKVALKDTRMQDVSRVILLQLTDANVGLRDFKEKVIAVIKIGEQPDSKLRNS